MRQFITQCIDDVKIFQYKQDLKDQNPHSLSNCFYHYYLPFQSSLKLRNYFIRYDKVAIRFGRLMELFDLIAGEVSYKFIEYQNDKATIVTACVDHIQFIENIDPKKDVHIQVYPSYIGKSTVEVQIDAYQPRDIYGQDPNDLENLELDLKTTAYFLMVARDSNDRSRAFQLPEYQPDSEIAIQLQAQGKIRQEERKNKSKNSLSKQSPRQEQIDLIHKFFTNFQKYDKDPEYQPISETAISKIQPMHFQDQNIHGNIFGGYIFREAFELGQLCALMFQDPTKYGRAKLKYIDDFQFYEPVLIGDILKFEAKLCYVKDKLGFVQVDCYRMKNNKTILSKTNALHLIFELPINQGRVFPVSYGDAIRYINGYNFVENYQKRQISQEGY